METSEENAVVVRDFRDLGVWNLAMDIFQSVYSTTAGFPREERFGLTGQMRRTAVSVPSNIAEGNGRGTTKDYIRFLQISRGAAAELETQVLLSQRLGYEVNPDTLLPLLHRCRQMLQALIRSLSRKLE